MQKKTPNVLFSHCFIHREALASKTLPCGLQNVLKVTIKIVNFVKSSTLHTNLIKRLCKDMGSEHINLLYYTKVQWLSKGNFLSRVYELRDELKICLNVVKPELAVYFSDSKFIACLAYLVDIFDSLNTLNVKMQGKEKNITHFVDLINGFIEKLSNWRRNVKKGNFAMFTGLADISHLDDELKTNVAQHLEKLECEFRSYFPELSRDDQSLARNPFRLSSEKVEDKLQDQFIDMKNDSCTQDVFEAFPVMDFWLRMASSYPEISKTALKKLPFGSTWPCESAFLTLLNVKTKQRNRLEVEQDIRCALWSSEPRIKNLVAKVQSHPPHRKNK